MSNQTTKSTTTATGPKEKLLQQQGAGEHLHGPGVGIGGGSYGLGRQQEKGKEQTATEKKHRHEKRQHEQDQCQEQGSGHDGLKHLIKEHDDVNRLFEQYKSLHNGGSKKEVTDKIRHMLSTHASIEERFLYPLFRDRLQLGKDIYIQMRFGHQHIKETLELLAKWDPDQQMHLFDELTAYLEMLVKTHMRSEERCMQELRNTMTSTELAQLDEDLVEGEKNAPTEPHSMGPSSALGAKIVHPVVGMMDQAKEKIKEAVGMGSAGTSTSTGKQ